MRVKKIIKLHKSKGSQGSPFQVKSMRILRIVKSTITILSLFFLIISVPLATSIGSVKIDSHTTTAIMLDFFGIKKGGGWTYSEYVIITQLRLPRVLMALLIGSMLAIAGLISQILFRNPIAEPYIIGVSSSAGLGATLALILGWSFFSSYTRPFVSFIFSLLTLILIYMISRTRYGFSVSALLLSGIAISFICSAMISFVLYLSVDKAHLILTVLMGKLWGSNWRDLSIVMILVIVPLVLLQYISNDLNLLILGDEKALSLGVNVKVTKLIMLIVLTLLSSIAVSFCGTIGFVGLIVPNAARIVVGNDSRKLIPLSGIWGGLLLIWADVLGRTIIAPMEIPVGIFTSFLGGPFFIYLVIKKKKEGKFS